MTITVRRTGEIFSIAGSQYEALIDGVPAFKFWSPPWNDYTEEEEDAGALAYAEKKVQEDKQ